MKRTMAAFSAPGARKKALSSKCPCASVVSVTKSAGAAAVTVTRMGEPAGGAGVSSAKASAGARSAAELAVLLALPLPSGWSSHYDGETQHIYFSNVNGEVSWERPAAPAARASSATWSR